MANPLDDTLFAPHADSARTFLIRPDGSALSYGDYVALAARFAHALVALGVSPGDRVAVQVRKSPEALALYAACVKCGAVFLPLNTAYTADEIGYFLGDAKPRVFVCDSGGREALAGVAEAAGAQLATLDADGGGSLAERAAGQPGRFESAPRGADDLAAILYTSGTTGRSKGAMLSQDNLLSNARALTELWQFNQDDVLLHALPIFHTHGLFVASNISLLAGSAMIFLPGLDMDQMIAHLPRATAMMGVPTFYTRLLDEPRFTRELASHMRLFVSGSAPLLDETHRAFEGRTGHRILERYGMTETNMNTSNPFDGERKAGTVGLPLPGVEVRVAEPDTGAALADGEVGVLEVKGPNVFQGYWQMPEKTASEFRADGFFITGDLATRGEDGYIRIVGRAKDLIISGGYNIYPKEIELLIDELDGVKESAVIGVPHRDFGEGVVAVVVAEDGAAPEEAAMQAAIRDRIARFKQPKRILVVDELPRNTMGKVQKNLLRDQYADLLQG